MRHKDELSDLKAKATGAAGRLKDIFTNASEATVEGAEKLAKAGGQAYDSATDRLRQFHVEHASELAEIKECAARQGKSTAEMAADFFDEVRNSRMGRNVTNAGAAGALLAVPVPLIGPLTGLLVGAALGVYITLTTEETARQPIPYKTQLAIALEELDRMRRDHLINDKEFEQQKAAVLAEALAARSAKVPDAEQSSSSTSALIRG
ncbi:MAG: hypothetical protein V4731_06175 [Pseudomonadota bacterium]